MKALAEMIARRDMVAWKKFLDTCTIREAGLAYLRASAAGAVEMRELAWKREQHLNGEHRHPELWT